MTAAPQDRDSGPSVVDGVGPSAIRLPPGDWPRLLDFLCARFADVGTGVWEARLRAGKVVDEDGTALGVDTRYRSGARVYYYRELPQETRIPFEETILHQDTRLLVVDKPHFLPVVPAGRYVQESLLVRLKRRLGLDDLVPLHRIDRGTAGLVLFSTDPATRGAYQALFAQRRVTKRYEALAPALPPEQLPLRRCSRIVPGEPFFRMQEVEGEPNSETLIECEGTRGALCVYRLQPITGRKHQLRVHMAALGIPIVNDDFYPELRPRAEDDWSQPLQLLARALEFDDPLSGERRRFESRLQLSDMHATS